jgi:hypothetical protein
MLDVGCGSKPKSYVNIDFFRSGLNPKAGNQIQGESISTRKIENFTVSDAIYLPFKESRLKYTFSNYIIGFCP